MARQIFIVDAHIVDQNGTFHFIDGYPKTFDSKHYKGDIEKTRIRAEGDMSSAWSDMCLVDTRIISTVSLTTVDGYQMEYKSRGYFPDEPTPEQPVEEPEE